MDHRRGRRKRWNKKRRERSGRSRKENTGMEGRNEDLQRQETGKKAKKRIRKIKNRARGKGKKDEVY